MNTKSKEDVLRVEVLPRSAKGGGKLGPFDLKATTGALEVQSAPLTVFIGPQGSGKSLLMQLLFLGRAFPYLAAQFVDREEEQTPSLLLKSLLDRLRRGEVRDQRRGFNSLVSAGVRISYSRGEPWQGYHEMAFRVYQTQNTPRLEKPFLTWVQHLTKETGWRKQWLRPIPAVFIPAERTFYSRFLNGAPSILQSPTLPLTMLSFTEVLNMAMDTFMGWSDGRPKTQEAQWVWEHAREALGGEAYVPPRGPKVWKWRLLDGTVHDLEMASSGQMEAWPLVLTAMCLLDWREDGTVPKHASLFVEEPEVHLHPLAQLHMLQILAYLVNKGIRVTFTTHSPLMLFLLNALLRAGEISSETEKRLRAKFGEKVVLPPSETRLKSHQVAVYEVAPDRVSDLMTEGEVNEDRLREAEWTVYRYFNSIQAALEETSDVVLTT